jgi:hypothetical protein
MGGGNHAPTPHIAEARHGRFSGAAQSPPKRNTRLVQFYLIVGFSPGGGSSEAAGVHCDYYGAARFAAAFAGARDASSDRRS